MLNQEQEELRFSQRTVCWANSCRIHHRKNLVRAERKQKLSQSLLSILTGVWWKWR